jgi:hypothetical protein
LSRQRSRTYGADFIAFATNEADRCVCNNTVFCFGYDPGTASDVYLYDFTTGHWWYTSSTLFPYIYDFTLTDWLYYFPNTTNPGHYTSNPRYFSHFDVKLGRSAPRWRCFVSMHIAAGAGGFVLGIDR